MHYLLEQERVGKVVEIFLKKQLENITNEEDDPMDVDQPPKSRQDICSIIICLLKMRITKTFCFSCPLGLGRGLISS